MIEEVTSHGIPVTRFYAENEDVAVEWNKPIGQYTALYTGPLIDNMRLEEICNCLTEELRRYLFPYKGKRLCVCGIGNDQQLVDSFGPETARRIAPNIPIQPFFEKVVVFSPSTSGRTNIETSDTISAIASVINASCVLAIDAMVSDTPEHIGSMIQIGDTGLKISWNKKEVNSSTVGIPVIGIGVPTLIHTKPLNVNIPCDNLLTVSNIKNVVENAALVVACAVMKVAYPNLSYSFARNIALF